MGDIINNNNNSKNIQKKTHSFNHLSSLHSTTNLFPTSKMRTTTTLLFIAGLVSTAFAADTIYFSDENWYVA